MQSDGNLVIYCIRTNPWKAVWNTHTAGGYIINGAVFQSDGNLVLYNYSNVALFHTGSANRGGARLVMQGDSNLVIYTNYGLAIWNSGTYGQCG